MGTLLVFYSLFVVSPTLRDFGVVVCRIFLVTDAELWAESYRPVSLENHIKINNIGFLISCMFMQKLAARKKTAGLINLVEVVSS